MPLSVSDWSVLDVGSNSRTPRVGFWGQVSEFTCLFFLNIIHFLGTCEKAWLKPPILKTYDYGCLFVNLLFRSDLLKTFLRAKIFKTLSLSLEFGSFLRSTYSRY